MKMNKYFLGLVVVLMGGLASCNTDVEGEYYNPKTENVGFEVNETSILLPKDQNSGVVPIRVIRSNTAGAYTAHYTAEANVEGIFSDDANGTVNFADGQGYATINVNANNLEKEVPYTYTMTLSEADTLTADTLSTLNHKEIKITVQREGDWILIGTGLYREDLIGTFWGVETQVYEVEILEHETQKGRYRVVNPYDEKYTYNEEGDWDASKNYYITINAQDPQNVYVESGDLGLNWGYGMISLTNYAGYLADANGVTIDDVKAARPDLFGKLSDGVITMPAASMLISMTELGNGRLYTTNNNGLFAVALPGHVIADYSAEVAFAGIFTNTNQEPFAVADLTLSTDITNAVAVVVNADDDPEAVADAVAAGDLEGTPVESGRIEVPIPDGLTGNLQVVIVILNSSGEVKNVVSSAFEYYGGGTNPWKKLGVGYLTDNFFINNFYQDEATETLFSPQTYEVEIYENNDTPGLYRLKNAFQEAASLLGEDYTSTDFDINAVDPQGVYFQFQSVGIGSYSISSYGAYMLQRYDFATLKQNGIFGTLENGVITLPEFAYKDESGEVQFYYQGLMNTGSRTLSAGYTDEGAFKLVMPGASAGAKNLARAKAKATSFEQRLKGWKAKEAVGKNFVKKQKKGQRVMKSTSEMTPFK